MYLFDNDDDDKPTILPELDDATRAVIESEYGWINTRELHPNHDRD